MSGARVRRDFGGLERTHLPSVLHFGEAERFEGGNMHDFFSTSQWCTSASACVTYQESPLIVVGLLPGLGCGLVALSCDE